MLEFKSEKKEISATQFTSDQFNEFEHTSQVAEVITPVTYMWCSKI